jgi:hypothetical protein
MLNTFLKGSLGKSGIQFVGGKTAGTVGITTTWSTSLTDLTGGIGTSPIAGDCVVLAYGTANRDRDPSGSTFITGYTGDSWTTLSGPANESYISLNYKFMGATPDTFVSLPSTGSALVPAALAILVFRGVSPVSTIVSSNYSSSSIAFCDPAPVSVPDDTYLVVAAGCAAHNAGAHTFTSSDLREFRTIGVNDTADVTIGMGYEMGSIDPSTFGFSGTTTVSEDSNVSITLGFQPLL